jgi:iron complex outermembrane receptor protein
MIERYKIKHLILLGLIFPLFCGNVILAQNTGTVTGVVKDATTGEVLVGANIAIVGQTRGVATKSDGTYTLSLSAGDYNLRATFIGYAATTKAVSVPVGATVTLNFDLSQDLIGVGNVVVLGSRAQDRTVIESTVPIDVITLEEIQKFGFAQTTAIIRQLVPSFNSPKSSVTDGTDHVNPATLRGLGPDQVLVLVNGKRRHTSALVHANGSVGRGATGVDLNAIPPNMIERIEVLRDGASAQYGSDAIAGVINIVLKKNSGFETSVSYGQHYSVDQRGYKASDGVEPGGTPQSWAGNPRFFEDKVTYTDGKNVNIHMGYGGSIRERGSFFVAGQIRNQDPTNRAGLDPRQLYARVNNADDPRELTANRVNHKYGGAELSDVSIFVNADYELEDNRNWYAFSGYSKRNGSAAGFFRRAWESNTAPGFSARNTPEIYPDGFLPHIDTDIMDFSLSTGIKGNWGAWNYDISETMGRNHLAYGVSRSLNASLGVASPTRFNAGALEISQASTNLDIVRTFDIGTASPLSFAVGGEFRYENYRIFAGEGPSYVVGPVSGKASGSQVFPGFMPRNATDESRTNIGFYVDLENEVAENLVFGGAARVENYSDFGSTFTGKFSGRYEFLEGLAVRGAVSTGFRAPSLAQSYFSTISTNFIGGIPFEVGTFPVNSPVARALGAVDLKAETSVNMSGGATFTKGNFSLTADYYLINIADRVVFSENFTGSGTGGSLQSFLASRGVNATGGRYFTNAVDSKTSGIDIISRYAVELDEFTLRATVGANFTQTEITNKDEISTPAVLRQFTSVPLFGRLEQGRYEEGQPKSSIQTSFSIERGDWDVVVRLNRFGEFKTYHPSNDKLDQVYSAKFITDLEFSRKLGSSATFAFGANNLLDVYPDRTLQQNSNTGIFQFSGQTPFGFDGRYLYSRLSVRI